MSSIFSKIIKGEIPCYKVGENEFCYAFLDINPIRKGHCLVVPKEEVDYLFDLREPGYSELMSFSKKVAIALKSVIPCKRIGVMVLGMEVPHAHIHLVPINNEGELSFSNPKPSLSSEEFIQIAEKVSLLMN